MAEFDILQYVCGDTDDDIDRFISKELGVVPLDGVVAPPAGVADDKSLAPLSVAVEDETSRSSTNEMSIDSGNESSKDQADDVLVHSAVVACSPNGYDGVLSEQQQYSSIMGFDEKFLDDVHDGSDAIGARKCRVCRNKATKHFHYGAKVCVSCRGFFQRAVLGRRYSSFKCKTGLGSCGVDSSSKRGCKHCRFQKCLEVGMDEAMVKATTDKEDDLVRSARIGMALTDDEIREYKANFQKTLEQSFDTWFDCMIENRGLAMMIVNLMTSSTQSESHEAMARLTPCQTSDLLTMDQHFIKTSAFELMNAFGLNSVDRMTLIMHNLTAVTGLWYSLFCDLDGRSVLVTRMMEHGSKRAQTDLNLSRLMTDLSLQGFSIDQVGQNDDDGNLFIALLEKHFQGNQFDEVKRMAEYVKFWTRDKSRLCMDESIMHLLFLVILFNPGTKSLYRDRKQIEAYQENALWQLHRYLRTKYGPKSHHYLHKVLMIVSYANRIYEIVSGLECRA